MSRMKVRRKRNIGVSNTRKNGIPKINPMEQDNYTEINMNRTGVMTRFMSSVFDRATVPIMLLLAGLLVGGTTKAFAKPHNVHSPGLGPNVTDLPSTITMPGRSYISRITRWIVTTNEKGYVGYVSKDVGENIRKAIASGEVKSEDYPKFKDSKMRRYVRMHKITYAKLFEKSKMDYTPVVHIIDDTRMFHHRYHEKTKYINKNNYPHIWGFKILNVESRIFTRDKTDKARQELYEFVSEVKEKVRIYIGLKKYYNKNERIKIAKIIGDVLRKRGYTYKEQVWLTDCLTEQKCDCDTTTDLFMTTARMLGLPWVDITMAVHEFVRDIPGKLNIETTVAIVDGKIYENEMFCKDDSCLATTGHKKKMSLHSVKLRLKSWMNDNALLK